jgi:hypothetical protein
VRRSLLFLLLLVGSPELIYCATRLGDVNKPVDLAVPEYLFGASVPLYLVMLLTLAFFTAWTFGATLRRFRLEHEPAFSHLGSVAFMATLNLLMLGLVWPNSSLTPKGMASNWVAFVLPTLLCLLVVMSGARGDASDEQVLNTPEAFTRGGLNGVTKALQLGLVAAAGWFVSQWVLGIPAHDAFAVIMMAFVTYLFIALVLELVSQMRTRFRHAVLVGGFGFLVYIVFPAVLGVTMGRPAFCLSGLDYLIYLLGTLNEGRHLDELGFSLVINTGYCAALLVALVMSQRSGGPGAVRALK